MSGPGELSPREAMERYLNERRMEATGETMRSYKYRLRQFVQFCESRNVETVADLNGWWIDEYKRSMGDNAPQTVRGKLMALKQMIGYLERIEAVDDGLEDKVGETVPTLSKDESMSDVKLAPDDAIELIDHYRDDISVYGSVEHALLEILWFTGCRLSGVRALDLEDYDPENGTLWFRNRPDSGTRLKNGDDGERPVSITEEVVEAIDAYVQRERPEKRDENGRQPLLSGNQGRPVRSTLRGWCYRATQPCVAVRCPHGEERRRCKYRRREKASKCPSSRSPHPVRTGSITWQLNQGLEIEVVADRVNATPDVIRQHYDVATEGQKLEERRREQVNSNLSLGGEGDE